MYLPQYLKSFKHIVWYPSAATDGLAMACLSPSSLLELGIQKEEMPDCFLYTDYRPYFPDGGFVLDGGDHETEIPFYNDEDTNVTAFNARELPPIRIGFNPELVAFDRNLRYYGRVFVADMLVDHKALGRSIVKLVYVFVENTQFAIDFLIKHKTRVSYVIHSAYGHGFGGGRSNGAYMFHILKDLGAAYFISDMGENDTRDLADNYLSPEQRSEIPILSHMCDFTSTLHWAGYGDTILYKVNGFVPNPDFEGPRYVLDEQLNNGRLWFL